MNQFTSASETPLVSAIVSTYNAERFIRGCLEDLEAQTIADRLEIVVIDSGSPQNEGTIVREFQQRYDNILYIRTAQRETLYAAWNRGIQAARGRYITNANTDDRHRRDAFERLAATLETRPDIALVYADFYITETENETFENHTPVGESTWPDFDPLELLRRCYMGHQPMWRKSRHIRYGYFDESFEVAGDWEFWLRMAENETYLHLREFLGLYLNSPASVGHRNPELREQENGRVRQRYRHRAYQLMKAGAVSGAVVAEAMTIQADQPTKAGIVSDTTVTKPMTIKAYKLYDHAAVMQPAYAERDGDAAPGLISADRAMHAASETGWVLLCPHAFEATWNGGPTPEDIDIRLDTTDDDRPAFVQSNLGDGRLTLYTGYQLQSTDPDSLWVRGPINRPKDGLYPLEKIVNTSLPATITITWTFTRPHQTVCFEAGEPFGAILPYSSQYANPFVCDVVQFDDDDGMLEHALQQLVQAPEIQDVFQRLQAAAAPAKPPPSANAPEEGVVNGAASTAGRMVDLRTARIGPEVEACLQALVVYQSPVPKARLGRDTDGGYVICDHLGPYQVLLSGGIGDDNSFEMDFIDRYRVDCYAFDHSVDHVQQEHPRLNFIKKSIGPVSSEDSSNLKAFISQFDDIFLKLDIEGGEFAWISALSTEELLKFKQIVIEIHFLFRRDSAESRNFLGKLTANHILVHLHANNCCGTTDVGGIMAPEVFECTFIRKDCYPPPLTPNQDAIPSALDRPNIGAKPDICLKGWPFAPEVQADFQQLQAAAAPEEPVARGAAHRGPLPPVSCICPTYGRVALLEEAIYCFLLQDYPGPKELIVLNDYMEQTLLFDHPEVRVINLPKRFRTVGEKRNAGVALASHDLLFPWDDDDIYLPHRLSYSVAKIEAQKGFFNPRQGWYWANGHLHGPVKNLFHASSCWSRDRFDAVRGYDSEGSGHDQLFEKRLAQRFPDVATTFAIQPTEIYYIYRWNGTSSYHLSGFGGLKPGENSGDAEVAVYVQQRASRGEIRQGRIPLQPHWKTDYRQLVSDYLATLAEQQPQDRQEMTVATQ